MYISKKINSEASIRKMRLVFEGSWISRSYTFMVRLVLSFCLGMVSCEFVCGLVGVDRQSVYFLVLAGILTALWGYRSFTCDRLRELPATGDHKVDRRTLTKVARQLHWRIVKSDKDWIIMVMPEDKLLFSWGFQFFVIIDSDLKRFLYACGTFGIIDEQSPFHIWGEYIRYKKFRTIVEKINTDDNR